MATSGSGNTSISTKTITTLSRSSLIWPHLGQQIVNRSEKTDNYLLEVDEHLRIPINRKVRFLVTSEDVIHAWWVPDFGIKRDAVPGMLNELWAIVEEPGIYRGQCTELCGKDHGFMPIVVEAMPEAEFDAWYATKVSSEVVRQESMTKTFTHDELMVQGEVIYGTYCSSCHMANGEGVPPVFPAIARFTCCLGPTRRSLKLSDQRRVRQCNASVWQAA